MSGNSAKKVLFAALVAVWTLNVISARVINFDSTKEPRNPRDKNAFCPSEKYQEVEEKSFSLDSQGPKNYAIGESVSFQCVTKNCFRCLEYPEEFYIYPSDRRKCEPPGYWSGKPPMCAWIDEDAIGDFSINSAVISNIAQDDFQKEHKKLERVGVLSPHCERKHIQFELNSSKKVTFLLFAQFPRHFHFSHITYGPNNYNCELFAASQDVIRKEEFSNQSLAFLSRYSKKLELSEGECAVQKVTAYASKLWLRCTIEENDSQQRLSIKFFEIPNFSQDRVLRNNGLDGDGCPELPHFPNNTYVQHLSKNLKKLSCQQGYNLIDPLTNKSSDGLVRCHNKFEWIPDPFPVCSPETNDAKKDQTWDDPPSSNKNQIGQTQNLLTTTFFWNTQSLRLSEESEKENSGTNLEETNFLAVPSKPVYNRFNPTENNAGTNKFTWGLIFSMGILTELIVWWPL